MSVSIHTQIQYRDKLRTRLGCIWFLVYEPTRPVGCSPRLIGCLDAPLIQAPLVQNLAVSLHPQKHHSPPFLHVQALASARGLHGCAWELHGCTRELEKVDTRMQAGERGNPRVTAPLSRHLLGYISPARLTSLCPPLAQCFLHPLKPSTP
jgi:hypothetical protein